MSSVLTIIVNYKTARLVVDCLASLEPEMESLPGSRVVIVDNASPDGSFNVLQSAVRDRRWGEWCELVRSPVNAGFAAGNNLAIRTAFRDGDSPAPDYVFFLNPDTYVRPGAIQTLAHYLDDHPDVGIVGGRSEDPDGTPQHCCFRFPSVCNEFASNARVGLIDRWLRNRISRVPISDIDHSIDWVSGAAMMMRRALLDQVGLFDEQYFLYYEETDLILRAARRGWTCRHVPESRIVHLVGCSSGVTVRNQPRARKPVYWFDSRRRFFLKNHGPLYATFADLAAILGLSIARIRCVLSRRKDYDPPRLLQDFIVNSVFFKGYHWTKPDAGDRHSAPASTSVAGERTSRLVGAKH